ncbi:MAG: hypothetical protein ACUVXJ_09775 [Phycisphaerae bacterium]
MPGMESSDQRVAPTPGRRFSARTDPPRSKARARRWWAIRSSTVLIFMAVALCFLVIWHRDRNLARRLLASLDPVVKELQVKTDALGVLPAYVPDPAPIGQARFSFAYTFSADERQFAIDSGEPCIMAYTSLIRLLLHRDGRCVICHHKGQIRAVWMAESDFQRQMLRQNQLVEQFQARRRSEPVRLP